MRKIIFFSFYFLIVAQIFGQENNMVKYFPGFKLNDGVYINFLNFKNNKPIPPNQIIQNDINPTSFYFYETLMQQEFLYILNRKKDTIKIPTQAIWGYCSKGNVFIQLNGKFNRIYQLGYLSHFVGTKIVVDNSYVPANSYWYYRNMQTSTTREQTQEFMLDFDSGNLMEFKVKNLLAVLKRDEQLFEEYNKLKYKKKDQLKFLYLRKFNKRNPIYFPLY